MFSSTTSQISPITQAELDFRADRARRNVTVARRRRSLIPFYGENATTAKRAD